ncbi:MAG: thiol oxidoreductase, partial [Candidatus Rokubacteria bacterium]|nr:thiol oxidoreductase [Candidatus Rokubacteria bacterium]
GDGLEQGRASGREMRTAPLWGLRARTRFLHDGRATTIEGAILAHEGQGETVRNRFAALHFRDRRHLLAFLNSL